MRARPQGKSPFWRSFEYNLNEGMSMREVAINFLSSTSTVRVSTNIRPSQNYVHLASSGAPTASDAGCLGKRVLREFLRSRIAGSTDFVTPVTMPKSRSLLLLRIRKLLLRTFDFVLAETSVSIRSVLPAIKQQTTQTSIWAAKPSKPCKVRRRVFIATTG